MRKDQIRDARVSDSLLNADLARDAMLAFADSPLFHDDEHRYEEKFYGRRLRPHVLKHLDFSEPARMGDVSSYRFLAANRVLYAINETDFLLLPSGGRLDWKGFDDFYSDERLASGAVAAPYLERYLFSFLEQEISLTSNWNLDRVRDYLSHYARDSAKVETLPSAQAIVASSDPLLAAQDFLIQLAPDFLIESSPMARYAGGSYGEIGSALFKIIIDELGYGEFRRKHSTLFEGTLRSAGLRTSPHFYWQYYLNGSLLLANYFNLLTRKKRNIFRYIGAIYLAETGFVRSCKIWRDALQGVNPEFDLRYFDEHCHIDVDHSRMVMEGLVAPAISAYGERAAAEIVRGFEEARLIGDIAERDFVAQTRWKDSAARYKRNHDAIFASVDAAFKQGHVKCDPILEPRAELSITHSHDSDELCHVVGGTMEFLNGFGKSTILEAGEGIVIEHNRLHGALIQSANCDYRIYTIGDVNRWL